MSSNPPEITTQTALAQQAFANDPKYKKYTQQVEKCLNSFDNVHEWADCIAFLKQLLKTFQSYMQFKEIPRKVVVAKRLAQCLNPALPNGVHQRALDVYLHVLSVLGPDGLKRDLALWSLGLFPFFDYAATSVKPTLLNIYDTHYLPLQAGLRPVMKSFILALLPGLEEETGEFFEQVLTLLDRLSGTVSQSFFFQTMWLIMLTAPFARGTSLNYLSRRLPRFKGHEDMTSIVGRDIGLMVRAFAVVLEDENLLVRRAALDLLLQALKIDSEAIKRATASDRQILMRAALSVVLRRDLALNRRLYSWLLGPSEKSENQVAFLKEHSLELLRSTLSDEMTASAKDYAESRPFKIFISLLDKWEIGAPLSEVLVYDAFKSIKHLVETSADSTEDVTMTASTLYEAVEPQILWKHFLQSILSEINGDGTQTEAISLACFLVQTFSQDEDVQTLYLPIVFSAIVDVIDMRLQVSQIKATSPSIRGAMRLLEQILHCISPTALLQRPQMTAASEDGSIPRPYPFACAFFGIDVSLQSPDNVSAFTVPFSASFQSLAALSLRASEDLRQSTTLDVSRQILAEMLGLMLRLVSALSTSVTVSWDPQQWLSAMLLCIEQQTVNFTIIDRFVSLVVSISQSQKLQPTIVIDSRPTMHLMVTRLLRYLHADSVMYHVRAVELIWALESSTKEKSHVEAILAKTMTAAAPRDVQEAYEAFGVLWRLTDDNLLPGFCFRVPLMLVLDALRNDDPSLRRVGETWMRCSLKAYTRVLDPILFDLVNPAIRRRPVISRLNGKELQNFVYERPFDERYTNHLLDLLVCILRFGGQGVAKTMRVTSSKRTNHAGLIQRIEASLSPEPEASYSDVLIDVLIRFLQSEPKESLGVSMNPMNAAIQSTAVELLQMIVARGELSILSVTALEAAVVGKLYFCVHTGRLDLQNKLLHLLHSLISAATSDESSTRLSRSRIGENSADGTLPIEDGNSPSGYVVNPLLVQTLVDGVTIPDNRPVLQHWLDFILMAVPTFQPALHALIAPLNECVCRQLTAAIQEVLRSSSPDCFATDVVSSTTDAEFIMLLSGLERLVLISLAYTSEPPSTEDEPSGYPEKSNADGSGLFGYLPNVFGSDGSTAAAQEEKLTGIDPLRAKMRSPGYRALREGIKVLFLLWSHLVPSNASQQCAIDGSLNFIYTRARTRCRKVLEHLFRAQSMETFEAIVEFWERDLQDSKPADDPTLELVDVLIANSQTAVSMICDSIAIRLSILDRPKKQVINPNLTDAVLFKFLELYITRLEGPLALQVWSRLVQLIKDILSSTKDYKPYHFASLRCLLALTDKITQTIAMEDRRIKKELQDAMTKLLDLTIVYVNKFYDQGSWIRRSTAKDTLNGRESPIPRTDTKAEEKLATNPSNVPDTPRMSASNEAVAPINEFLATVALPHLRRYLVDGDKMAAACNSIVYYIVSPAMKGKTRPLDIDPGVVAIIAGMSHINAALKAWKGPVLELVNDNRLFNCSAQTAMPWKPIVRALFNADKAAFPELLTKVATAPSANIFTNREYEMLLRSLNVRRLSFVLLAGEKNQFITQLPTIQEKLVDMLRNVTAPIVQSEVYLCIRVLLCRLSPHNLTSFWPVLLTELYRLFEQIMLNLPSDGSDDLQVVLAASKCLDLLIALQTEEFQIHQWMFVTDTVDAIYRPDDAFPEAMMDQLAEIAGSLPATTDNGLAESISTLTLTGRPMRRPLLVAVRQIDSIRDLVPFFSSVSISSYESVYASRGDIDWEAVEQGLIEDMFDGK
ncbi:hypothetical protein FISHEDRAFT_69486 [Fistulina hepatica ATCC 64428]|uniref:Uncharacterized protein n=1 Tax=Fistulina hepatica ATCC 64428 TaxID=1128425 RepID=A0A0D7ALB1_9AGAR|nr:hypothetical protein FISHEDRAFT_69486 [Fistulina hepatica ATCC 64428]